MSRFAPSPYSDSELLAVVREVCRHAQPQAPLEVTESVFGSNRSAAGYPDAPSAARICTRLGRGWLDVKTAALGRGRRDIETVRAWKKRPHDPTLTEDVCVFALQLVATRRGEQSFTRYDYDETAELLRAEGARRRHGGRAVIPTATQITTIFKTWAKAMKAAGLVPPKQSHEHLTGLSYLDALELALEMKGALPASHELEPFIRRACGLRLERRTRAALSYPEAVEELRRRRTTAGKWTPPSFPPKSERPDWTAPVELDGGPERRPTLTDERIVQYLMRFLTEHTRQTVSAYVGWASHTDGAPSASSMARSGRPGFAAYRAQARERLRKGERPTV